LQFTINKTRVFYLRTVHSSTLKYQQTVNTRLQLTALSNLTEDQVKLYIIKTQ